MSKVTRLRKDYPQFVYERFEWEVTDSGLVAKAHFSAGKHKFEAKSVVSGVTKAQVKSLSSTVIDNFVFHLGLAEIPSYWKATCSPLITIKAGALTSAQLAFWHKLLVKGMRQYFFENKIDFRPANFLRLESVGTNKYSNRAKTQNKRKLVAVGGGKDSAVALELLKNEDFATFAVNPGLPSKNLAKIAGSKVNIEVKRQIDPRLLELNSNGYLNGHTPISSIFALLSVFCAYLFDCGECVFANEASSNEGNITYLGKVVNHQYSKTYEFEHDLRLYNHKYLSTISYYSLLRPIGDLAISRLFAASKQYHQAFLSCNVGAKQNKWCCVCAKCLSTFILLAPFMELADLVKVFGHNLFADASLVPLLQDLVDAGRVKPFECVGTRVEIRMALTMAVKRFGTQLPLLAWADNNIQIANFNSAWQKQLSEFNSANFVPAKLAKELRTLTRLPLPLVWLRTQKIVILGFGVEGQSSYRYIRYYLPGVKLAIADKRKLVEFAPADRKVLQNDENLVLHLGSNYLASLPNYTVVFKSPGVPEVLPEIKALRKSAAQIYSVTRLFFELCQGQIIGVTGTVGKTTTVSLIQHVLEVAGKDSVLVGNIGKSPLDYLLDKSGNSPERIWVVELSSYELIDLPKSPYIAVWLNVFQEHLDYHGGYEAYFEAKSNIARHQTETDLFIFNSEIAEIAKFAKTVRAQKVPYALADYKKLLGSTPTSLIGAHNKLNVLAAYRVADKLGVTKVQFKSALATFVPVAHRLQVVGKSGNIRFVDDSISTVPQSALAAVDAFAGEKIVIILGGYDRGVDYSPLAKLADYPNIVGVVLAGQTADNMQQALGKFKGKIVNLGMARMGVVVPEAVRLLGSKGTVLLSPAATSFDLYDNYIDRGKQFAQAVGKH